jgi:hypothetical protein
MPHTSSFFGSPARLRLAFFLLIGVFAQANPGTEQRIQELKEYPERLDAALVDGSLPTEAASHFRSLFADPSSIRSALRNQETPLRFKRYLVAKIGYWIRTGKMPSSAKKDRYVLAMLAAFRDSGPLEELRELAYKNFVRTLAHLNDEEKSAVLNSLRQYQSDPDGKAVALAALVFLDPVELTVRKLPEMSKEPVEVQQLVLEALAREKSKKNQLEIQLAVVPYVASLEEKVREAAARVLYDPRVSVLAVRDRLFQRTLALLADHLADSATPLYSVRLIAKILGVNRATTFFEYRSVTADQNIHASLTDALKHTDRGVRLAAAEALDRIKPPDTQTQLALASTVTNEKEEDIARAAFTSLGGEHAHIGDHRIRESAVKQVLLDGLQLELRRRAPRPERIEWVLNLLDRNPPTQLDQVNCLADLYSKLTSPESRSRVIDIIRNASLNKRGADQSQWTHDTLERLQGVDGSDPLFEHLVSILEKSGTSDSELGTLLASDEQHLRDVGVGLLRAIAKNRFAQSLQNPQLIEGLASALLRAGKTSFTTRQAILKTLHSHARAIDSRTLWNAIIANLKSTDPQVRAASANLISAQLSIRGRDRGLPLEDQALIANLKLALKSPDTAPAANKVIEALARRRCSLAIEAQAKSEE